MIVQTKEKNFSVGALWATIGIIVAWVITQSLRDYAPESVRLFGILGIAAWIFFWFGSKKTANVVYRFADTLSRR